MAADKLIVLVTGGVGSGKTRFLTALGRTTGRWWRTCGFVSPAAPAERPLSEPGASYDLSFVRGARRMPWATRRKEGRGFEFRAATRAEAIVRVRGELEAGAEVCFIDEIGRLELEGGGFAGLFRLALTSPCRVVVAAVKKSALAEAIAAFDLAAPLVVDLDTVPAGRALRAVRRRISASEAGRVGTFAGAAGMVEVGLGSTLHAYRVPFKGHALSYLQNVLLVTFGKALNGRGLFRISFISAMLKAFSPAGARFRPMLFIFLQGACFAAPVRLLGWHLLSVLAGSVLMAWLTLGLSLGVDFAMFGQSIFDAFSGAISFASDELGIRAPSLIAIIGGAFLLKGVIALGLAAAAYCGDVEPFVGRLRRRGARRQRPIRVEVAGRRTALGTALGAARDLLRPRFAIAFVISALLLLFFTNLSRSDLASVVVRGLVISYLGFVAVRRVDLAALGGWLDRRTGLGLAESLPAAMRVIEGAPLAPGGAQGVPTGADPVSDSAPELCVVPGPLEGSLVAKR